MKCIMILSAKKILKLDNNDLKQALYEVVPVINEKLNDIIDMIDDIPEKYNNMMIISSDRREYYKESIEVRFNELLYPAYENIKSSIG